MWNKNENDVGRRKKFKQQKGLEKSPDIKHTTCVCIWTLTQSRCDGKAVNVYEFEAIFYSFHWFVFSFKANHHLLLSNTLTTLQNYC